MSEVEVYMRLDEAEFEASKKRAKEDSIDEDPNSDTAQTELLYANAQIIIDDCYLEQEKDAIFLNGTLRSPNKELGYISLTIPLSQEMAIGIIERYLKKLGKLKTVLEATK